MTLLIFVFMLSAAIALPRAARGDGLGPDHPVFKRVSELTRDVRQYVTITTGINLLVGVGDTIFLWIMGVDFALLWGLLAWLLGYIPSVGFWLAAIPPVILAWATNGVTSAIIVFIGFVLINGAAENLVKPKVMGEGLSISPVLVLVSVIVWGWLLGGIGAIIAVPLTLLILSVLDSYEGASWFMVLLRPAPEAKEDDTERREALDRVRDLWGRVTDSFRDDEKRDAAGATADAAAGAAESDGEPLI
jgi:predicted PurR-regulated permease PerM